MFSAKQFRIIVHLDNFFKDHRREARIFINKSTKTVADLENHITQLFNINDFFLSCQNCFLPSAEDVRILQEDETIWVWPKPASSIENCKNPKGSVAPDSSSECSDVMVIENKSKKLKTNGATCNKDKTQINNGSNKSEIIKNNKDVDDDDDDDDSSSEETDDETQNQPETLHSKNTQTYKEMEGTKNLNGNDASDNTRDDSIGRSSVRSFKAMSSIGALMDSLRTSVIKSDDSFVNKSRRKRVRKRKRSSKVINGYSSVDTPLEPIPIDIPKPEIKSSAVHMRFSDVETASAVTSFEVKEVPLKQTEQITLYNYSVLNDDDFSKYPLMQNTLPRAGDVISFKVLKISDNYNPEVSKYIVAKVIDYNVIKSTVSLKILYGMCELVDPQGKFYIEGDEDKDTVDVKEMQWAQLIAPRLLFP